MHINHVQNHDIRMYQLGKFYLSRQSFQIWWCLSVKNYKISALLILSKNTGALGVNTTLHGGQILLCHLVTDLTYLLRILCEYSCKFSNKIAEWSVCSLPLDGRLSVI